MIAAEQLSTVLGDTFLMIFIPHPNFNPNSIPFSPPNIQNSPHSYRNLNPTIENHCPNCTKNFSWQNYKIVVYLIISKKGDDIYESFY